MIFQEWVLFLLSRQSSHCWLAVQEVPNSEDADVHQGLVLMGLKLTILMEHILGSS